MRLLAFILGIFLILLALLARAVGLDHDAAWGASRYLLLFAGLALAGGAALVHLYKTGRMPLALRRAIASAFQAVGRLRAWAWRSVWISAVITVLLLAGVSAYATWYISFGLFPKFTRVTNPYVDLGEAFLHGQVALLAQPDPRLVALPNPYDAAQREQVPYLWDLSYYQGKYYAYWGPVPALLYAAVEAVAGRPAPDQMGVLVFYGAFSAALAVLLFDARRRFFPRAPALTIPLFLLVTLINLPVMHILERGQVYETSVIAGQFFLFAGLLAWLRSPDGRRPFWLLLAGLSWGLAIATRYNLALTAGIFTVFALYRLWRACGFGSPNRSRASLRSAAALKAPLALLSPLALIGLALALYNYARFGSPFETGLVYQLTIPVYQNRHFSPIYILSNLYAYLSYPLAARNTFPFFPSLPLEASRFPTWAALPKGKLFDEVFFGMGPSLPVLWMAVGMAVVMVGKGVGVLTARRFKRRATQPKPGQTGLEEGKRHSSLISKRIQDDSNKENRRTPDLLEPGFTGLDRSSPAIVSPGGMRRELILVFLLAALLQLAFLLFYYFAANRFIIDFLPLALLALVFLAWEADEILAGVGWLRILFWLAAALLVLATVVIAVFAGFDIVPQFFRLYNPDLYHAIAIRADRAFAALLALPDSPGLLGAGIRLVMRIVR